MRKREEHEGRRQTVKDLLVVCVKCGVVHKPLHAAIVVSGVGAVVAKLDVDGLSRRRWFTRAIRVQGYRLVKRILSSRLEKKLKKVFEHGHSCWSPSVDLHCRKPSHHKG